jgi:uncharacterized protein YbbC (DUF1343 family)
MIETGHGRDAARGVPLYSLYGDVRRPTPEMLEGLDVMMVDLQDVGARGYTFAWTMLAVMEACAEKGVPVVVWDRPNPINGADVEGPLLRPDHFSFVGMHEIPIRHGLTLGELARMTKEEKKLDLDLSVRRCPGWRRSFFFEKTGRPWIMPSPNIPGPVTALVYAGMELLEGTNVSEGRGTTRPFEWFGAPFIDSEKLCRKLNSDRLPGVFFRPAAFEPTFDKWRGELCHGAQIHVLEARKYRSVAVAVAVLHTILHEYPREFRFREPPYEYEEQKLPFDILAGGPRLREDLASPASWRDIVRGWEPELKAFRKRREPFLLYR